METGSPLDFIMNFITLQLYLTETLKFNCGDRRNKFYEILFLSDHNNLARNILFQFK